jgi:hypothetical protein
VWDRQLWLLRKIKKQTEQRHSKIQRRTQEQVKHNRYTNRHTTNQKRTKITGNRLQIYKQASRQTNRQTEKKKNRQTEKHTNRQTNK